MSVDVPHPTSSRGRIAVIDDDAVFVDLMRDLLGVGEGYDVFSTPDWPRTLEFVREVRPDLIILDLMLGRSQTGWQLLELLREDPSSAGIPVILCSAAAPALRDCQEQGRVGSGALEVVAKPFDLDELIEVVERMLQDSRARATARE
jgi:CheY-like chemotaxis protein